MEQTWLANYDKGIPHLIDGPSITLPTLLSDAATSYPFSPAVAFYGRTLNYSELQDAARRLARGLIGAGLVPGERVMLLLPNVPQLVIAYYGVLLAGGIVVLSNPLFDLDTFVHQLDDSGAATVIALSLFHELVARAQAITSFKRVIYTNLKEYLPTTQRYLFTLLRQENEGHRVPDERAKAALWFQHLIDSGLGQQPELPALDPKADAVILYTSGTTGEPKGVVHTHSSLVANARQISAWIPEVQQGEERFLCAVPFSHSYGMSACMNCAVNLAASMVLLPTFETQNVLHAIRREKPTIFPGVPPMYAALNEVRDIRRYGLSSIKACVSGAAPLPIEVQEGFERITRGRLVEGYGLTEAGPVTHANPLLGRRRAGYIGLPLPSTEARIVHPESGAELPVGEIGELLVRGPQLMRGYWNRPAETAEVLNADGWLRTGDLARMNSEGYFQLIERKKEMIIAGSYNIYPRDVEEVLYEYPKIIEAAVVGSTQGEDGTLITAHVVLREGEQASEEEVIAFLRDRLPAYMTPANVVFRKALPRSFIGKILRRALAE
jgi:long-chain acyl-CoA synthetase